MNNKQGYIYASYQAAEMAFFEYYEYQFFQQIFQVFHVVWFEFSPCLRLQIILSLTSKWLIR